MEQLTPGCALVGALQQLSCLTCKRSCLFFIPLSKQAAISAATLKLQLGPNHVKATEVSGCRSRLALFIQKTGSVQLLLSSAKVLEEPEP